MNFADEIAFRREALDAVSGAGPNIAVHINAKAVRDAGRYVGENAAVAKPAVRDVEGADVMRASGLGQKPESAM